MDTELRVCEKSLLTDDYCLFLTEMGGNHQQYDVIVIFKSEHDFLRISNPPNLAIFLLDGEQLAPPSGLTSRIILWFREKSEAEFVLMLCVFKPIRNTIASSSSLPHRRQTPFQLDP